MSLDLRDWVIEGEAWAIDPVHRVPQRELLQPSWEEFEHPF